MSEPEHIGTIIARAFRDVQPKIENGEVRARERCICNPCSRLIEVAPKVYIAQWGHDSWCPVVGGKGRAA